MAAQKSLQVGDRAPEFTLPRADGELVSLADYREKSDVVLFFYPKDHSPACTAEACSFRDSYEVFRERGRGDWYQWRLVRFARAFRRPVSSSISTSLRQ